MSILLRGSLKVNKVDELRTVGDRREGGQAVQWKTEVDAM